MEILSTLILNLLDNPDQSVQLRTQASPPLPPLSAKPRPLNTDAPNTPSDGRVESLADVMVRLRPSNMADTNRMTQRRLCAAAGNYSWENLCVFHMAGFYNSEAAGEESDEVGERSGHQGISTPRLNHESSSPFPSSSSQPSTSHLTLLEIKRPYVRSGSNPTPGRASYNSNMREVFRRLRRIKLAERGAFPTRLSVRPSFKTFVEGDAVVSVGSSQLGQSPTIAEDVAEDDTARSKPSSTSENDKVVVRLWSRWPTLPGRHGTRFVLGEHSGARNSRYNRAYATTLKDVGTI